MNNTQSRHVTPAGPPASMTERAEHAQTWDAVETYFECITTCSLDDGECITQCVEQLKDTDS
ncbi:MAG: hypothetical protein QNL17_03220 [Synechococcus sp. ChSW.bin.154]